MLSSSERRGAPSSLMRRACIRRSVVELRGSRYLRLSKLSPPSSPVVILLIEAVLDSASDARSILWRPYELVGYAYFAVIGPSPSEYMDYSSC